MKRKRSGQTVQLNASIPSWLMEKLKEMAKADGRSLSNLVTLLLKKVTKNNLNQG